ncbi:MAG: lysine transporter LysE, partial [Peptococcaceae bacterium]
MGLGAIFVTAFLVGLSGAMMPGPLLTVTIGETTRQGFRAGPLIVFGHGLLEAVLVLGLAAGLMAFLADTGVARVIALFGGCFLVYLGINMIRDTLAGRVSLELRGSDSPAETGTGQIEQADKPKRADVTLLPLVLAGILTSLSNPYWTLWWATIGLGYITLSLQNGYWG